MVSGTSGSVPDPVNLRRKTCTRCHTTKTWGEFNPRTTWPDGRTRTVQSWCTDCVREHNRERQRERGANPTPQQAQAKKDRQLAWRMRNLEQIREKDRQIRARRLAADPDGFREKQRQIAANYRNKMKAEAAAAQEERGHEVPFAPFRDWLRQHALRNQLEATEIAARVGVDEARIRVYLRGDQATIRLSTVDRVLCRLGRPDVLDDLYPYTDQEAA